MPSRAPASDVTGPQLAALRAQAGLTRAELAAASGYAAQYLAHIEQGRYPIHPRFFRAVMAALVAAKKKADTP